jgi:hypothetical protein
MRLVSLPAEQLAAAADLVAAGTPFAALIREPGGVSLTISDQTWLSNAARFPGARLAGPYRALTLDLDVDPLVSGFLAPATARLAAVGVAVVPQCGYLRDHLLVGTEDLERAVEALRALIEDCRRSVGA